MIFLFRWKGSIAIMAAFAILYVLPVRAMAGVDMSSSAGTLVRIDGTPVSADLFREFLEYKGISLAGKSDSERKSFVQEFAVEWKMAQDARSKGLDRSREFREAMEQFRLRTLPEYFYQKEFFSKADVSEADFVPFFHGLVEYADVEMAVFPERSVAEEFRNRVQDGLEFGSHTSGSSEGNRLLGRGYIRNLSMGDVRFTLEEKTAILSSAPGEVVGPFENRLGGISLFRVVKRETIEDQKEEIREKKREEIRRNKAMKSYLLRVNEEMVRSEVEINEEYFSGGREGEPRLPYIAWVKGKYIYPRGKEASRSHHGSHPSVGLREEREELDRTIQSIIAADLAVREGFHMDPEYRIEAEVAEMVSLASLLTQREVRDEQIEVADDEVREHYGKYFLPEVHTIYLLTNADRDQVRMGLLEIEQGKDPSSVAVSRSDDLSRLKSGVVGPFPISMFEEAVQRKIASLPAGEFSDIFSMGGKYAAFRMVETRTVPVPPLSEIKDSIRERILLQKRTRLVKEMRKNVFENASLIIDEALMNSLN